MGSKLRRLRRATSVTPTSIPVPPLRGHGPSTVDSDLMVYGVGCCWFDNISKVSKHPSGLPCCPFCGSLLMQAPTASYWRDAQKYEDDGHPGYVALLKWQQGKCFKTMVEARAAYAAATSTEVPRG
jgi:hypothetical protein